MQGLLPKTVSTSAGDIDLHSSPDRAGTFIPTLIPRGSHRTGRLGEMIISLYTGGITDRDIAYHLETKLGAQLSLDTISKINDEVLEELASWQKRPLEEFYPILSLDSLVAKARDGHQMRNKAAHTAIGVTVEGIKHVLGLGFTENEGEVLRAILRPTSEPRRESVPLACCDGLTGLPRGNRSDLVAGCRDSVEHG